MDLQRNTTRYFTPMLWLLGPFLLPSCQDKHNKSTFQDPIIAELWNPDQHIPQIPQKIERPQRSSEHEKQSMFIALPQLLLLVHVYSDHSLLLNYIFSSVSVGYIIISIYIYKHSFLDIDCNNPMRFLSLDLISSSYSLSGVTWRNRRNWGRLNPLEPWKRLQDTWRNLPAKLQYCEKF